jgi:peptidyl-tRNA hydrolase, PTH1 family
MILIAGIGNKDTKYHNTRHNAGYFGIKIMRQALRFEGFMADDAFKHKRALLSEVTTAKWGTEDVVVLQKTQTAMNNAGEAVKRVWDEYGADELVLFHDDLDIILGDYKIQKGKSPKGHNGVKSVEKALGTTDFWRVRLGIDSRDEDEKIPGEEYVLQRFDKEEREMVKATAVEACEDLLFTELFEKWI